MKKKEILEKYKIKRGTFSRLCHDNIIVKNGAQDFSINEEYMKNFNEVQYTKDWKNRPEQKEKIAERNKKVNLARWSKCTAEQKEEFKQKVSKGVRKAQALNPECIERMRQSLKLYWSKEENKLAQSVRMTKAYENEEARQHLKAGTKKYWSNPEARKAHAERMTKFWAEHPEIIEAMKETNRQSQLKLWTPKRKEEASERHKKLWANNCDAYTKKRIETMKAHGTKPNSSIQAERCKALLKEYGFTLEEEKSYPEKPKYPCDAYIVELDTWIEFHFGFFHNHEPYIGTEEQQKQIEYFWSKALEYNEKHQDRDRALYGKYGDLIKKWTIVDVEKKQLAEKHNLTWFAFYAEQEFKEWLSTLIK